MTIDRLLHCYPPAWRERYGAELATLLEEGEISWRVKLDVICGGLLQRLRGSGLTGDDAPGPEQLRSGVLLVLSSWSLFVIAGCAFAKFTENWQSATPDDARSLPAGAFNILLFAAEVGTAAVLVGIAAALSAFVSFLREGGWPSVRRPIVRAVRFSVVTVGLGAGLVVWAHHLTSGERHGASWPFGVAFVLSGLLVAGSIALWTVAAVATARRIRLTLPRLRLEAWIACAVTVAMLVMTFAAVVWWGSVTSPASLQMFAITLTMVLASALAVRGSSRSLRVIRRSS